MDELLKVKENNPLWTRLKAAADAMKEDYTSVIAEDEVGPCTPPTCAALVPRVRAT